MNDGLHQSRRRTRHLAIPENGRARDVAHDEQAGGDAALSLAPSVEI
jgi:hypothetical protein